MIQFTFVISNKKGTSAFENSVSGLVLTLLIIKITISSIVIGLQKLPFSTNSLSKLLSDSLLLDSLLSDSSISQSHSKL